MDKVHVQLQHKKWKRSTDRLLVTGGELSQISMGAIPYVWGWS